MRGCRTSTTSRSWSTTRGHVFFNDPDGNDREFVEYLSDDPRPCSDYVPRD